MPVAELDRGFIRPEYPNQVVVSYYQAGRICDYIQERWGADKLLDIVALSRRPQEGRRTSSDRTGAVGPGGIRQKQFLACPTSMGRTVANFDEWRAKLKEVAGLAKNKNYEEVLKQGEQARRLYPDYIYPANPYEFMHESDMAKAQAGRRPNF